MLFQLLKKGEKDEEPEEDEPVVVNDKPGDKPGASLF